MKQFILFLMISSSCLLTGTAQIWRTSDIILSENITDGVIEDVNRDGRQDLLLVAGNFVNLYFQNEDGFSKDPDQRIFYKLLGDYICFGDVDPVTSGLELLGLSEQGIKCFKNIGAHFVESPGYMLSARVDFPEYKVGPVVSSFAFDINSDGRDEIFLLQDGKMNIYYCDDSGRWIPVEAEGPERSAIVSLSSRNQAEVSVPANQRKRPASFYRPSAKDEKALLFQDFNHDGLLDMASNVLRLQGARFRFYSSSSPLMEKGVFSEHGRHAYFLDVNGDGNLDRIDMEAKSAFSENINVFPFAKIHIYLQKSGGFTSTPDYFQKTMLVNDQSPFVDVDGDETLDFISVWSDITPGSKEVILQVLLESTWSFAFRCYLFDKKKGYALTPDISLKAKIERNVSDVSRDLPFDISGDFDGNGTHDLLIKKDPKSVLIYFIDLKRKGFFSSVRRIDIPGGYRGLRIINLDGDGRSDLVIFTDKGVRTIFFTEKLK